MEGLIAAPKSRFVKVECKGCGNAQVIFDHAASTVKCVVCGAVLAEPKGGRADLKVPVARAF